MAKEPKKPPVNVQKLIQKHGLIQALKETVKLVKIRKGQ